MTRTMIPIAQTVQIAPEVRVHQMAQTNRVILQPVKMTRTLIVTAHLRSLQGKIAHHNCAKQNRETLYD